MDYKKLLIALDFSPEENYAGIFAKSEESTFQWFYNNNVREK